LKITEGVPVTILFGVYIEIAVRMILVIIVANMAKVFAMMSGRLLMFTDYLTWENQDDSTDITQVIGKQIIEERKRERHG